MSKRMIILNIFIYGALTDQRSEKAQFAHFFVENLNFARLTTVFWLKKSARLFTKMSPSEELFTLQMYKNGLFMGTEGIFETI